MFKFVQGLLPRSIKDLFVCNSGVHQYSTRQLYKFHNPKVNTSASLKSIRYSGIKLWNYVSDILDYKCSIVTYKQKLKYFLLFNDIQEY